MELDYGTQLSPLPITLTIGRLIKPTLQKIADITFDKFGNYEFFLKITPEFFYTKIKENGQLFWNSLSDDDKKSLTLYDVVLKEKTLKDIYVEIFNFFFEEQVIFKENLFVLLDNNANISSLSDSDVHGVISKNNILQVLYIIQQICCIANKKEEKIEDMKFKNELAKKLFKKMQKAKEQQDKRKKTDINLTLPNIISAVSNKHPTINPINVWDLTVFQLIDSFNRMQMNAAYDIDSTRVSVWGDEKKTFNAALWYKNDYDKK